ncbi:MAG TPA: tetratricopeptide repeat protein [Opitutaceae bacterium]
MAPAQFQRLLETALAHHQKGRLVEAEKLYKQGRAVQPNHFDLLHLSGALAFQQGRYAEALDFLNKALRLNPRSAQCIMRLGLTQVALGNYVAGETQLRQATKADPKSVDAWSGLAVVLRNLGKLDESIAAHQKVAELNPKSAEPHAMIGGLLSETKGAAAAIPHFQRAIELDPHYAAGWCNLGISLLGQHQYAEAREALDRALKEDPQLIQALVARGIVDQQTYRLGSALTFLDRAIALAPAHVEARSGKLLTLNYLSEVDVPTLYAEHRAFGEAVEKSITPVSFIATRDPNKRLRIGFVSPDLRAHSIAYFLEPLLQHLDPIEFEVFLYHNHAKVDAMSERLRTHARSWKNLVGLTNEAATKILRADQLDVAIDLAGHTGFNRLYSFAQRVAPVQITYLGYPNTTGLKAMDFRFVDSVTDPARAHDDTWYTEKRIRFSDCGWAFSPPVNAPEPARAGDATLTFGSFNNPAKLSAATLRVWSRLLRETPSARLLLKGTGLTNPETRVVMESNLQSAGVELARVEFMDRTPNLASHLEIYHRVDVALDPFPYAGTTTTCEALWMGVPVVTLSGDRHAARVGASLLSAIGHREWIAHSEDEYVAIAKKLAESGELRRELRSSLRSEMSHSSLLNHAEQAKRFGAAVRACWQSGA